MMRGMYAHIDTVTDMGIVMGSLAIVASAVFYLVVRWESRR